MRNLRKSPSRSSARNKPLLDAALVPVMAALLFAPACGAPPAVDAPPTAALGRGPRLHFEYVTIDERALSSETLAGRFSVITFIATYDVASQAQARFLADLLRDHKPRINAAALVLEAQENKPLVEAFVGSLRLSYPVALADAATIAGEGPFAGLHHVPSVVVLDREGREVWRRIGLIDEAALDAALTSLERGEAPGAKP